LARRASVWHRMRFSSSSSSSIQIHPSVYPTARRDESIVDNYHGTMVPDPYRWMEDPDSEETRHFVDQLNAISEPFIAQAASRETIRKRTSAWTQDGSILAYGLSEKGSDWFRGVDKKDLEDTITGVKHSSLSWMRDKSGLFYCKYPDHKTAIDGTSVEKHENHSLYFHRMGTDCKDDVLVYDRRDSSNFMIGGTVTEDGRYLIIDVSRGCDPFNMMYYYDLSTMNGPIGRINPTPLFDKLEAKYE
ncbi:hypothetical protein TELCIR_20339, partial [Teladorsagia circumcincta]